MERVATHLALHGAVVLTVGLVAGLLLHRAIRLGRDPSAWHLAHAGVSGRGVLLLALAGAIPLAPLPPWQLSVLAWLVIFFVWTSTLAMVIAAASGHRGLGWRGSGADRLVFGLYVIGAVAIFPAAFLLVAGLLSAL